MTASRETATGPSTQKGAVGRPDSAASETDREFDWTIPALISGIVGAMTVAVVFLAVDIISGRPALWTPAVLGAALFTGDSIAATQDIQPRSMLPLVFGYTLMHVTLFISFGAMAASGRLTQQRVQNFTLRAEVVTALLLFIGLEVSFFGLGWIAGPGLDLAGRLGSGWVAFANALAAIGMTATIARAAAELSDRPD